MMRGIITKSIGGLYLAESSDGVYECKARGIFRKQGISPSVGDDVEFENPEDLSKVIDSINASLNGLF